MTLRVFRKTHLYFGLFISPALLFFAFTGAVQTLSLHEAAGSSYKPPAILAELGQLHKKQTTEMPVRKAAAPEGVGAGASEGEHHGHNHDATVAQPAAPAQPVTLASKQRQHLPLKIFFLVVALGLLSSTLTGIYMSYKYERSKLLVTATIIAGVVVPVLLVKL
jgi:uncharacterized iron-regulated membrane protein